MYLQVNSGSTQPKNRPFLAVLLAVILAFTGMTAVAFADSNPSAAGFTEGTVTTSTGAQYTNLSQVNQGTDATTFGSPMHLSTIYIDMDKITKASSGDKNLCTGEILPGADPGFVYRPDESFSFIGNIETMYNLVYYDASVSGATQIQGASETYFPGNLFAFTYKDAAILSDGTRANVKITYSNLHIFSDVRFSGEWPDAIMPLARGANIVGGTFDRRTDMEINVNNIPNYAELTGDTRTDNLQQYVSAGIQIDARVQIVDGNGNSVEGTFISPANGFNQDRSSSHAYRPMFKSSDYDWFSESIRENSGNTSEVYVRTGDYLTGESGSNGGFHSAVGEEQAGIYQGATRFKGKGGRDNDYNSGFLTTSDAAAGQSVTVWTGGNSRFGQNSYLMGVGSATLWHRIISTSGPGGTIQTTTEANAGAAGTGGNYGALDDKGDLLGPGTYVVPDGKTVVYTFKAQPGYGIDTLRIGDDLGLGTDYSADVRALNIGETKPVQLADGKTGTLKRVDKDTYTFDFPENNNNHCIHVTWKPVRAEVKAIKKWYDKNDTLNTRRNLTVHVNGSVAKDDGGSSSFPADYLPAQVIPRSAAADGNEAGSAIWGNEVGYTGTKGEVVYKDLSVLPPQTPDDPAQDLYYFYDHATHKFVGYTYNTTTGKYSVYDGDGDGKPDYAYYVDFLPKYDADGERIEYTVKEDVPVGYSQHTIIKDDGSLATYPGNEKAKFEYVLSNTLEPVGTVRAKATKAMDGRTMSVSDDFIFVLAGEDGAPMPVKTAVKLPTEGEDTPDKVVAHATGSGKVIADADFGVIAYRKSDLTATEVTYADATDEQKKAIRFWTLTWTDPSTDEEITRTFDMNDSDDEEDFKTNLPGSGVSTDPAEGTFYDRLFTYTVTENPKHPDYVENDDSVQNMKVRVLYNERENKLYIDDEDSGEDSNGVRDITAEKRADLSSPNVILHKDFFTNIYSNETGWDPEIVKTLNGRPIERDQFKDDFTIKALDTTESVSGQTSSVLSADDTPMPADDQGEPTYGGTAQSGTQDVKKAAAAPQGTNGVRAIVGFDTITYTNDDLKKEVTFGSAHDDKVIHWTKGDKVYGPVPAEAEASVTAKPDGTRETVKYGEATDAQREEAADTGWTYDGKTYIDDSLMTAQKRATALAGARGSFYLDQRSFTYKIWESGTAGAGYTNDTHSSEASAYTVVVTVTRNADGTLTAAPKVGSAPVTEANNPLRFVNTYEAKGLVNLKANKVLNGRDLSAGEFTFTVTPKNGAPAPARTSTQNDADGTIDFGNITFTQESFKSTPGMNPGAYDAVRTEDGFFEKDFIYEITETAKNSDGLTSDTRKITCVITVREDDEGNITVVAVNGNPEEDTDLKTGFTVDQATATAKSTVIAGEFTNKYQASGTVSVPAMKILKGGKLRAGDFYFQLLDNTGNVIGTTSNAANGTFSFTQAYNLDQVRADRTAGICESSDETPPDNGPWTYTYKVKELKADNRGGEEIAYDATGTGEGYEVTVTVTDDGKGNLTAAAEYDGEAMSDDNRVEFTNTVSTRDLTISKIWIDKDADGISEVTRPASVKLTVTADTNDTSILKAADGWTVDGSSSVMTVTLTKADDATASEALWRKTIEDLPRYKADGSAITYTVDELDANVPANYVKSVVTEANTVINTYDITSLTGTKKWVDGEKPHKISADLDGKLTVKWTDAGGGSGTVEDPHIDYDNDASTYTVIGLPKFSDNGKLRTYYVEETQLPGYKAPAYDNSASSDPDLAGATDRAYNGGIITNVITGKIDVTGTKVWKGGTGNTPNLTLHRQSTKAGSTEDTAFVSPSATWTDSTTKYAFSNQDRYDDEGYEYEYWVTEEPVPGYLPPVYSDGDKAYNGGTITNVREPEGTLDIPVTKILTGSTRLSEWSGQFELSLYTGSNGSGTKIGSSKTVGSGTLAPDGNSDSAEVIFAGIPFRVYRDGQTVKAAMNAGSVLSPQWIDLTKNSDGTFSTTVYVYETPITSGNAGLTQPAGGGTPVQITLINNNDGTLTVTSDTAPHEVLNKHGQTVEAKIAVKKILNGRDLKASDGFTFTAGYVADDSLPAPEQARLAKGLKDDITTGSTSIAQMTRTGNTATGTIPFTFTRTGTYKFKVTESGKVDGVTNDAKEGEEVTVTVTKNEDGTLNASVSYEDGSEADFTNKYDAKGDARLSVHKAVSGTEWDENMAFWFKLQPDTAPEGYTTSTMPRPEESLEGAHKDRNKTANWDLPGFRLADAGKEFIYSVQEQEPSFTGYVPSEWQNDLSMHYIKVVPYDNGDGTMGFRQYYAVSNEGPWTASQDAALIITNRKKGTAVNLFASKEVVDENGDPYWPAALGSFDLVLTGKDGAPMPAAEDIPAGATLDPADNSVTVPVSDPSEVNFGLIHLDDEYSDLQPGEPENLVYEVTEVTDPAKTYIDWGIGDTDTYTITVTVAKDGDGNNIEPQIVRRNAAGEEITGYAVVRNRYEPEGEATLTLTKDLQGRELENEQFSFTLYDANKQVAKDRDGADIKGKKNDANGRVTLGTLGFDADDVARSPITYNIREDIPAGAKAADDETITYAADTSIEVRDAHVWVKDGITYDPAISHPVTITLKDKGDGTIEATPSAATGDRPLTVTNIYEAEGTQTFGVYKYLDERPIKRAGFTFELKSIDGAPMPAGVTGNTTTTQVLPSATYSHEGTASFADIVYTMKDLQVDPDDPSVGYETKTFEYEIREVPPASAQDDGLTYANTVYLAAVEVKDNGDGTLTVTQSLAVKSGDESAHHNPNSTDTADFTNIYHSDGTAELNLAKTVMGRAWQDTDEFTLLIEPAAGRSYVGGDPAQTVDDGDVPLPGNTVDPDHQDPPVNPESPAKLKIKGSDERLGAASRIRTTDPIAYTDEMLEYDPADGILKGTFFYKVTEDTAHLPGGFVQTTGSTKTYYVRVDVTDDRLGHLDTVVSYFDADDEPFASAPLFSNTYDASRENIKVPVTKYLDVEAGDDAGWSQLADSDAFSFSARPVGAAPPVSDGQISIAGSTEDHTNSFNITKISLSQLTQITTAEGQLSYSDSTAADPHPVPANVNYNYFVGEVKEDDLPAGIKGVDKDETVVYAKVTAIDDLQGGIDIQFNYYSDVSCTQEITFDRSDADDIEFVNTIRDTMNVTVKKEWLDGDRDTSDRPAVTLTLTRQVEGGTEETLETLDGNGKVFAADGQTELTYADGKVSARADQLPVTFRNVPSKNKLGHDYNYDVTETAPNGYALIRTERDDDPDGDPETRDIVITFTNSLSTKVNVEKVWKDAADDSNRGQVIVAALKRNGQYTDDIMLVRAADDWKATFDALPMYDVNGQIYEYTAKEMAVPEAYYTSLVEYSLDGESWKTDLPSGWNADQEKFVRITNILLRELEVKKVWDGIPVTDVTYELYRTTAADPSPITEDPDTGRKDWTPDDTWEKVTDSKGNPITHTFLTTDFDPETGGESTYTFTDLERYDKDGKTYTYRVKETTEEHYFTRDQDSDVQVTNDNDYSGSGKANPNVVKELEGREWIEEDDERYDFYDRFSFRIEPVKKISGSGDELTVDEFTDSAEDVAAKAHVPMPAEDVAEVTAKDTRVGAIGRSVDFGDITFLSGNGPDAHVKEGKTAEYYYKIYEEIPAGATAADDASIIYGDDTPADVRSAHDWVKDGVTYVSKIHYLTIAVSDDGDGKVETRRFWDGNTSSSAVPVFTNTYEARGMILGYTIKRIAGREFKEGDEFTFEVTNLAGAPLRFAEDADPVTEPTPTPLRPVGYGDDEGVYVEGHAGNYIATGEDSGQDKATTIGVQYMKSEDLKVGSDGIARGTFLYAFREWKGISADGREEDPSRKVEDLDYDDNVIYMRLTAVDDQKGNIELSYRYFLDAACKRDLKGREGQEPRLLVVTESTDESVAKVGDIAPAGSTPGTVTIDDATVTYGYIEAGYFRNTLMKDIPVTKEWVDENDDPTPATDNVTVELYRYPVYMDDEGNIYSDAAHEHPAVLPETYGEITGGSNTDWQFVRSDTFEMGSFTEENDYKYTLNFEGVDIFEQNNNGVPTGRKYVFRVKEITGSQAYETTYATVKNGTPGAFAALDTTTKDKNTLSNEDGLAVRNRITATNTAGIAAAKQLVGRDWLWLSATDTIDRYHFRLTPLGKGKYDENGNLKITGGRVDIDPAAIPMPAEKYSREATGVDDAVAADRTQLMNGAMVIEAVGEGERLARFGQITYTQKQLTSNPTTGRMQGDFFYELGEVIPAGAKNASGQTYGTEGAEGPWTYNGVTYDGSTYPVHVKVRENRTGELVVQVAYREETPGDISTGTQFTPVFTNRYDASAKAAANVDKYIMGRNWKEDDVIDFAMSAVGGAPFRDADPADFGRTEEKGNRIPCIEDLRSGKTVHSVEGAHVKRMGVPGDKVGTSEMTTLTYPEIAFRLSDLNRINSFGSGLKYSTGGTVPDGVAYGEFTYLVEETDFVPGDYPKDLLQDDNAEYIKYTVIDKGDGTLDISWKIYEDWYGQTPHVDPKDPRKNVTDVTFINQALRDIKVVKTWRGEPPADAVVTLEYGLPSEDSDEEYEWTEYDAFTFEDDAEPSDQYDVPDDVINGLTVPVRVYEHTFSGLPVYYDSGANPSFSDVQLKWRIVETDITGVETYYGVKPQTVYDDAKTDPAYDEEADVADDPTIEEKKSPPLIGDLAFDPSTEDLDSELYVTNVYAPEIEAATAYVSVVKDIKGRNWNNSEEYEFRLNPVGIGTYDADGKLQTLPNGRVDRDKLKKKDGEVITDIPMPSGNAKAKVDADHPDYQLSDSQWQAYFGTIPVPVDKLEMVKVGGKNVLMGDFFYDMTEVMDDALAVDKDTGEKIEPALKYEDATADQKAQYDWKLGDMICDTRSSEVRVHVERAGDSLMVTVSYNGKTVGGAVPVFTNHYSPSTIDIPVTKTWADKEGDPTDPVDNATVNLRRYAVFVNPENGKYYEDAQYTREIDKLPGDIDKWEPVDTHTFQIGDFYYTGDDTIPAGKDVGDLKDSMTHVFTGLATDELKNGEVTGRKYIYRIREAAGSSAYETTYRVGSSGDPIPDWTGTDTMGDPVGVVNMIEATNVANIAAVKQLVGRDWEDTDAFSFKLTAVKGVLPGNKAVAAADVPMPEDAAEAQDHKATAEADRDVMVGYYERLARFGQITYTLKDLAYNTETKRMEGDFYYTMNEVVPSGYDGYMAYDGGTHRIHVQVFENRSDILEVIVAYDETEEGDVTTGTRYTPVFINRYADVSLTAKKVWVGDQGVDGAREKATDLEQEMRPDNVTFVITAKKKDGSAINIFKDDGTVDFANGTTNECRAQAGSGAEWKHVFGKLPKYYPVESQGKVTYEEIEYTVDEDMTVEYELDDGAKTTVGANYEKELMKVNGTTYIINTFKAVPTIDVPVMKKWNDGKDEEGLRPDEVRVRLLANGERAKDKDGGNVADLTLNDGNNWKRVFREVPAVDGEGEAITYTVAEMDGDNAVGNGGTTFDGKYTVAITGDQTEGYVITNSHETERFSVTAEKVWDDSNGGKAKYHSDVILHLYGKRDGLIVYDAGTKKITMDGNGRPEGTATWTKLPKRHYTDEDLTWEVVEDAIPGYVSRVSGSLEDGFTVTNVYEGPVTEISVSKEWNDDENAEEKRPAKVIYQLWKKVGDDEEMVDEQAVDVESSAAGAAAYTWTDLPVTEEVPDGEATTATRKEYVDKEQQVTDDEGRLAYKRLTDPAGQDDPAKGEIVYVDPSEKEVYDADTENYEPVMEEVHEAVDKEETVQKTRKLAVLYYVKEVYEADDPELNLFERGYDHPIIEATGAGEFKAINIRHDDTVDVKVTKIWDDDGDAAEERPDHIGLTLINASGDTVQTATVTKKNAKEDNENVWVYTFHDVPMVPDAGYYTVEENAIRGYTASNDGVAIADSPDLIEDQQLEERYYSYTITNTRNAAKISLTAVKRWEGDDKYKNKRQDVTLHLIKVVDGEWTVVEGQDKVIKANRTVAAGKDAGSVTWKDLPVREKGENVSYYVQEVSIDGYSASVSDVKKVKEKTNEFEVVVTNRYGVPDMKGDVIYVDPRNPSGKMIVGSTRYDTYEQAKQAANAKLNKPKDPSHGKYRFLGWDLNYDSNGNYVLVATYSDPPAAPKPVVSYVDGQRSDPLLISKKSNDPNSVKRPADPKHKNLQFVGWKKTTDAAGNTIFVAQYKADCGNGSKSKGSGSGSSGSGGSNGDPGSSSLSKAIATGDGASLILWIVLILTSALIMIAVIRLRRRENRM